MVCSSGMSSLRRDDMDFDDLLRKNEGDGLALVDLMKSSFMALEARVKALEDAKP